MFIDKFYSMVEAILDLAMFYHQIEYRNRFPTSENAENVLYHVKKNLPLLWWPSWISRF